MNHPRTLNKQACPPIQIYSTDIVDLYVTQDPLAVHLLEVDALNVEEDMDLIPPIKFLAHNTGLRLSQLEGRFAGNGCSLLSKFPHQEIRRWTDGGAGMFAGRVGNLLQGFSCVHRIGPILEMNLCFAEIPVLIDGAVQFVDVETLVLKNHGVQEPCNELLPLTVRAVEGWVEINCQVTAVKSPRMVKHREEEISEAPVSELYSSRTLKQWEDSLQYPFFRHASRSRLELGDCLQAGCLQGGDEGFEHGGEAYSLSRLLGEAEDGIENAVNPFSKLRDVWDRYATAISMFLSIQYAIIMVMLGAVLLKYGMSEFYSVLLSAVFVDLFGVVDRKRIRKIYEPRSIEMEPITKNTSNIHHGVSTIG